MTPKRHSFLPVLHFTCFCINQYYIFKQIWTKRTIRKLDSSHSGIQIKVRNQFIYPSSSPLDNKILYKLIKIYVKQFTWSYDCLYKLPPVFLFIFTSAVSWIMELLHMKENCKNILWLTQKGFIWAAIGIAYWETIVASHSSKTLQWVVYAHYPMACAEDRTKLLVKSVCKTVQKSLFLLPPPPPNMCTRIWVCAMIGLF